jgi:Domain of unknown function (DUF4158)
MPVDFLTEEQQRRYGRYAGVLSLRPWPAGLPTGSGSAPNALFDLATARLVERKVLLPGVTVLARLVAQVRDRTALRLWRTPARALKPRQSARLETLLVADEVSRQSPLERLRRAPARVSMAGLVEALQRLRSALPARRSDRRMSNGSHRCYSTTSTCSVGTTSP